MNVLIAAGNQVSTERASMIERYALRIAENFGRRVNVSFAWRDGVSFVSNLRYRKLVKALSRKNDILHVTSQAFGYLLQGMEVPSVVTCHDFIALLFNYGDFLQKWSIKKCRQADRIIAVSNNTKKDAVRILEYPEKNIDVIYHGIDKIFRPFKSGRLRFDKDYKYILHTGSDMKHKNTITLLKAVRQLSRREDVKLVKSFTDEKTKSMIRRMGIGDSVISMGYIKYSDLPHLYNSCDVFAFPSLYEGFGMPPLEAMACGLPVICSNASSLPEVVGNAAISFDPRSSEELARKMHTVLNDSKLHKRLVKKGLERANLFKWKAASKKILGVYEQVLKQ